MQGPWAFTPFLKDDSVSIQDIIVSPLREPDRQTGHLYMYARPSDRAYLKIGNPNGAVEERLQQWVGKRRSTTILLYKVSYLMPNARRVEALIHTELAVQQRRESLCKRGYPRCKDQHIEWFETNRRTRLSSHQTAIGPQDVQPKYIRR